MIRDIEGQLFKVNTYSNCYLVEVTNELDECVQNISEVLDLKCIGFRLNLLVWLARATIKGYAIQSVTEFNSNGSKPKIAYVKDADFIKILNFLKK